MRDCQNCTASSVLPSVPFEIQIDIFHHLHAISPSAYTSALLLSKNHHRVLVPLLYRSLCLNSSLALERLATTLLGRPELRDHVRTFFFRGPQGRRSTGREQLQKLAKQFEGSEDDEENNNYGGENDQVVYSDILYSTDELRSVGLEPGTEGDGQEATWDEHESQMHYCTLIVKLCSPVLASIGYVDCVPWFLAPVETSTMNKCALPNCSDFTGVTVGTFGLLPMIQRDRGKTGGTILESITKLKRIHLIGGDFGSFALQRVLIASPTAASLQHLHITAPTLYRPEHYIHLVAHIVVLLKALPSMRRLSVGFLHWLPAPPILRERTDKTKDLERYREQNYGTGDDSFERAQLRGHQCELGAASVSEDSLLQCRQAYGRALPEALEQSGRQDVSVAVITLPFVEGTSVGFAGWILSHAAYNERQASIDNRIRTVLGEHRMRKRDLNQQLPSGVAYDGAPIWRVWEAQAELEWTWDGKSIQGSDYHCC